MASHIILIQPMGKVYAHADSFVKEIICIDRSLSSAYKPFAWD